MKTVRNFLAALFAVVAIAACSSSPTAPDMDPNLNPFIGSGIGGG